MSLLNWARRIVSAHAPAVMQGPLRVLWGGLRQAWQSRRPPQHLFVFGGRTHYWPGMGRELYAQEPAFRQTVQECEQILLDLGGPSLLPHFEGPEDAEFLANEGHMQQLIIVTQLALLAVWRAYGIEPTAVLGASSGEAAAMYAAGGISLMDALRLGISSTRISQLEPASYGILTAATNYERAASLATNCPVGLFVVSVVEEQRCFLFSALSDIAVAKAYLKQHGVVCHQVKGKPIWPYHTPRIAWHIDTLQEPLLPMTSQPLRIPCYLTSIGHGMPPGMVLGVDDYLRILEHPVQLYSTLKAALRDGYRVLTPIGSYPFPFLSQQAQRELLGDAHLQPTLEPGQSERGTLQAMRQELLRRGIHRAVPAQAQADPLGHFLAQFEWHSPAFMQNPHPTYAFLRRQGNLHYLPQTQEWLVVGATPINSILRQPQLFSSSVNADFDPQLVGADPPDHTRSRATYQPSFSPRQLTGLSDFVATELHELVGGLAELDTFDFVGQVAIPLTQAVSGEVLGLTAEEQARLRECLRPPIYGLTYVEALSQLFEELLPARIGATGTGGFIDVVASQVQQGELELAEAGVVLKTMWAASTITTSMLLSSACYYLLTHPATLAQLRADPSRLDAFIEEILRLEPPQMLLWRVANQPVTVEGITLPAGSRLTLSVAAANRDPTQLASPDTLQLHRPATRHLAFGAGIHTCMGGHLARLEARIVVQWLLDTPALRLRRPSDLPDYFPSSHFRGLAALPVTLRLRASV